MKFLFILVFSFSLCLAQENIQTEEQSVFDTVSSEQSSEQITNFFQKSVQEDTPVEDFEIEDITTIEQKEENDKEVDESYLYNELSFDNSNRQSQNVYVKFTKLPNKLYALQRFSLEIEAMITTEEFTKIETRFLNGNNISILNPTQEWTAKNNNAYFNSYFLKINSDEFKIPTFQIIVYNEDVVVDIAYLEAKPIEYTQIALGDNYFSNVIADDLQIVLSQTKQYSNTELFTVLEMISTNGNLEEFHIQGFKDENLVSSDENYPKQTLTYSAIIPIHTKEIKFSYFNALKNQFEQIIVPIKLEEELISTQTDLNPSNSGWEVYKKISLGVVAVIFILLYLIRRKNIFIIIAIVFSIIFFIYVRPNSAIVIESGTKIYILPTNKSTIFYITPSKQIVEVLDEKKGFKKIIFKLDEQHSATIGWLKEEDIVKN